MTKSHYQIPNDQGVSPEEIKPNADLSNTDLSEAKLSNADLESADLSEADLSGADLSEANLSGANLVGASLHRVNLSDAKLSLADLSSTRSSHARITGADLTGADLSEADLRRASLSESNLHNTNFERADLTGASLKGALVWNTSLSGALISRNTVIDRPAKQLKQEFKNSWDKHLTGQVNLLDAIARANHEIKSAYSNNGLVGQSRRAHIRERRARRLEARVDDTFWGTLAWLGSLASRWTTGYGVKLLPVVGLMLVLFLGSAAVYWATGMTIQNSLYYSVITFTTSPPTPPEPGIMRSVAAIETFFGTTSIVFLGYVLGTRDRV